MMLHIYSSRLRASVQEIWQGDEMLGGRCSAAPRILGRRARWSLARARNRTKWRRPCLRRWGILWLNSRADLLGNCVQRDCPASKQVLKGEIYQNEGFGLRRLTVQGGEKNERTDVHCGQRKSQHGFYISSARSICIL
jgi:hypothetical protein